MSSCVKGLQNPFHINKRPSWRSYFKKTVLGAAGSGAICSLSLTAAWLSYVWSVCQHNSLDSDCLPLRWLILELRPRGEPVPSIWFRTCTIPPWLAVSLFRNLLFSKHRNYESFAEFHTDWWHCHPGMRSRLCQDRFGGDPLNRFWSERLRLQQGGGTVDPCCPSPISATVRRSTVLWPYGSVCPHCPFLSQPCYVVCSCDFQLCAGGWGWTNEGGMSENSACLEHIPKWFPVPMSAVLTDTGRMTCFWALVTVALVFCCRGRNS